jgi:hypothetical protein
MTENETEVPEYVPILQHELGEGYDLESDSEGNWYLEISQSEVSVKLSTSEGNLSHLVEYLGSICWDYKNDFSYARQLSLKNALRKRDILNDDGELIVNIPSSLKKIFDYESSGNSKDHKLTVDMPEEEKEIAKAVQEMDLSVSKSRFIAKRTSLKPGIVGLVMQSWENEYDLDPADFRIAYSNGTSWHLELLRETEVEEDSNIIDDILDGEEV